jgi:hypothetical protein
MDDVSAKLEKKWSHGKIGNRYSTKVQTKVFTFKYIHQPSIQCQETLNLGNTGLNNIARHNPKILIIEDDEVGDVEPMVIVKTSVKARRCFSNSKLMIFWYLNVQTVQIPEALSC